MILPPIFDLYHSLGCLWSAVQFLWYYCCCCCCSGLFFLKKTWKEIGCYYCCCCCWCNVFVSLFAVWMHQFKIEIEKLTKHPQPLLKEKQPFNIKGFSDQWKLFFDLVIISLHLKFECTIEWIMATISRRQIKIFKKRSINAANVCCEVWKDSQFTGTLKPLELRCDSDIFPMIERTSDAMNRQPTIRIDANQSSRLDVFQLKF